MLSATRLTALSSQRKLTAQALQGDCSGRAWSRPRFAVILDCLCFINWNPFACFINLSNFHVSDLFTSVAGPLKKLYRLGIINGATFSKPIGFGEFQSAFLIP